MLFAISNHVNIGSGFDGKLRMYVGIGGIVIIL